MRAAVGFDVLGAHDEHLAVGGDVDIDNALIGRAGRVRPGDAVHEQRLPAAEALEALGEHREGAAPGNRPVDPVECKPPGSTRAS